MPLVISLMAEDTAGRRSKRRCVTTKSAVPSAVHYVGYVEDDETPEMIMRKFDELNKVGLVSWTIVLAIICSSSM